MMIGVVYSSPPPTPILLRKKNKNLFQYCVHSSLHVFEYLSAFIHIFNTYSDITKRDFQTIKCVILNKHFTLKFQIISEIIQMWQLSRILKINFARVRSVLTWYVLKPNTIPWLPFFFNLSAIVSNTNVFHRLQPDMRSQLFFYNTIAVHRTIMYFVSLYIENSLVIVSDVRNHNCMCIYGVAVVEYRGIDQIRREKKHVRVSSTRCNDFYNHKFFLFFLFLYYCYYTSVCGFLYNIERPFCKTRYKNVRRRMKKKQLFLLYVSVVITVRRSAINTVV